MCCRCLPRSTRSAQTVSTPQQAFLSLWWTYRRTFSTSRTRTFRLRSVSVQYQIGSSLAVQQNNNSKHDIFWTWSGTKRVQITWTYKRWKYRPWLLGTSTPPHQGFGTLLVMLYKDKTKRWDTWNWVLTFSVLHSSRIKVAKWAE